MHCLKAADYRPNFSRQSWHNPIAYDKPGYCSSPEPNPFQRSSLPLEPPAKSSKEQQLQVCHDYKSLPLLHAAAFLGDVSDILDCLTTGDKVDGRLSMVNESGQTLCGVTPLFLAAQRGNLKAAKVLCEHGANPEEPVFIKNSAEICTPRQVAFINLNLRVALYLLRASSSRKQQDRALKEKEQEAQRLDAKQKEQSTPKIRAGGADTQQAMNLSDLTGWNPTLEDPAAHKSRKINQRLLSKLDFRRWRPDHCNKEKDDELMPSNSRAVNPRELEEVEVVNQSASLGRFLGSVDMMQWIPEEDEVPGEGNNGHVDLCSHGTMSSSVSSPRPDSQKDTEDGVSSSACMSWSPNRDVVVVSTESISSRHDGYVGSSPKVSSPASPAAAPREEMESDIEGVVVTAAVTDALVAAVSVMEHAVEGLGTGTKARARVWAGTSARASARAAAAAGNKWPGVVVAQQTRQRVNVSADMGRGATRWYCRSDTDDSTDGIDGPEVSPSVSIASRGGPGPYAPPPFRGVSMKELVTRIP